MVVIKTGLTELNDSLGGGLYAGSVGAIRYPVDMSIRPFYRALLDSADSVHMTLSRQAAIVRGDYQHLDDTNGGGAETLPTVVSPSPTAFTADSDVIASQLESAQTVLVEPVSEIERSHDLDAYKQLLNNVQYTCRNQSGVTLFAAPRLSQSSVTPHRKQLLTIADTVFNIEKIVSGREIEILLSVPRNRLGDRPEERLKVNLGGSLTIDTSRDIA